VTAAQIAAELRDMANLDLSGRNRRMAYDIAANIADTSANPTLADLLVWQIDLLRLARRSTAPTVRNRLHELANAVADMIEDHAAQLEVVLLSERELRDLGIPIPEQPIAVGDTVTWGDGSTEAKVLVIDGDEAGCRWTGTGGITCRGFFCLVSLRRVS